MKAMTLRVIALAGLGIFSMFFYFTFHIPGYVEEIGKDFIKYQIKKKVNKKIESIKLKNRDSTLARLAGAIYRKNQKKIDAIKLQLKEKAHEKLAEVIAEMRDLNCECRKRYAAYIESRFRINIATLQAANEKLKDFMRAKYMEVATELKQDVRIFTGSNALIFLLVLMVSFLKPGAITHLFLPGMLLVTSTLVCSFFYIFEQNWLFTIIYNDYLGYGYLTYVGVLFLFLCDIVFNHGRVTTEIINAMLEAIGHAASVLPC